MRQIIRLCCGLHSGDIGDPIMSDDWGKFVLTLIRPNTGKKMYKDRIKMVNLLLHDFRINVLGLGSFFDTKRSWQFSYKTGNFLEYSGPSLWVIDPVTKSIMSWGSNEIRNFSLQTGTYTDSPLQIKHFSRIWRIMEVPSATQMIIGAVTQNTEGVTSRDTWHVTCHEGVGRKFPLARSR